MKINKILILFKTHLDIGFTDFSKNVVDKYMNEYIPNAISVSRKLREEGCKAQFKWTTGSWLIHEYLRTHSGETEKDICKAIERGDICWHGLPCTTHTELMSASLFEYGLSLSAELDKRFAKKTVAAKMTDVPGHTKAMIPHLKKAGIEFLHIGVNPASAVPEIPPVFIWRAESGEEITVMYNTDYGAYTKIGNTGIAVYFAHTGDNLGGQSAEQVKDVYATLEKEFPNAELIAADLNDVALAVRKIKDTLPVITDEIGDSWIHGIGTDPRKISVFKGFDRLAGTLSDGEDKKILQRALLMVCEHTWGLNGQHNLGDHGNYLRKDFEKVRCKDNYRRMEASWEEQRHYLTDALERLSSENQRKALQITENSSRVPCRICGDNAVESGKIINLNGWEISFDDSGAVIHLKKDGLLLADENHKLFVPMYEQFSASDYKRFYGQYNRFDILWAQEDFTKIGLDAVGAEYMRFFTKAEAYKNADGIAVKYKFPNFAFEQCGCPEMCDLLITADSDKLYFDFAWFNKPANRMTEAFWIGFRPIAGNKRIRKLGTEINPKNVVYKGNRRLHGTDFGVVYDEITIESVDSSLVAPGKPSLLNFIQDIPADDEAIYFNLYNNVWNTNFPMWYDECARFRFTLRLGLE